MLRPGMEQKRVVILTGTVDMRKGVAGLAAIIRLNYNLDPMDAGTLFLFCGRKRDSIKGAMFEGDGYCLVSKKLLDGRYQWPGTADEARQLTPGQFRQLMEGFTIESSIRTL